MGCKTVTFRKDRKGRSYSTPRRVELCDSPRGKRRSASRTKSTQVSCRDGSTGRFASCDTPRRSRDEVRLQRQRRGSRAETMKEYDRRKLGAWKREAKRKSKREAAKSCPPGEVWVRSHTRLVTRTSGLRREKRKRVVKIVGYCRKA